MSILPSAFIVKRQGLVVYLMITVWHQKTAKTKPSNIKMFLMTKVVLNSGSGFMNTCSLQNPFKAAFVYLCNVIIKDIESRAQDKTFLQCDLYGYQFKSIKKEKNTPRTNY